MTPFLRPASLINEITLHLGDEVADFGSGSGYWSVELAKRVGSTGRVFAFDVVPQACEATRLQAKTHGVGGLVSVHQTNLEEPEATGLEEKTTSGVVIANILFQSKAKEAILKEAERILRPGGWLFVIEWDAGSPLAPRNVELVKPEWLEPFLTKQLGLRLERRLRPDPHHWAILFVKPNVNG